MTETELQQLMVSERDVCNSSEQADSLLISGLMTEQESKTLQTQEVFTEFQQIKGESEEYRAEISQESEPQIPELTSQMLRDALKNPLPVEDNHVQVEPTTVHANDDEGHENSGEQPQYENQQELQD